MADTERVESTIKGFLRRSKKSEAGIERDTALYADGIGLDSLSAAELSAVLEDELGSDPFSQGEMPQTVGEILDFYSESDPAPETAAG